MEAFLDRFCSQVLAEVGDPSTSARVTRKTLLADLHDVDRLIFASLQKASGQESILGYAETTVTLKSGQTFYPLPPGFRNFIEMQLRDSDGNITDILRSRPLYGSRYGVQILTSSRGFRVYPPPVLDADEDWTLLYQRAPGLLHHALSSGISANSLSLGTPESSDDGSVVLIPGYYNGCEVRIYDGPYGPQSRVVGDFTVSNGKGTLHFTFPWDPVPVGSVPYEVCPTLPYPEDQIYALDVAIRILSRRRQFDAVKQLSTERRKSWDAALQYILSNVSDRTPAPLNPMDVEDWMPSGEIPL